VFLHAAKLKMQLKRLLVQLVMQHVPLVALHVRLLALLVMQHVPLAVLHAALHAALHAVLLVQLKALLALLSVLLALLSVLHVPLLVLRHALLSNRQPEIMAGRALAFPAIFLSAIHAKMRG
jgi:hypothetical protein